MISLIVILTIVISIFLGYKLKINTGFFAMAFAYIIGCYILNLKPTEVISMWPIRIFYTIFSVSLFYNFAMVNGTLENLSQHLIYSTRKVPYLLPLAIFFAATFIAALGAGYFTVLAFFGPVTLILCDKTGLNKLIGAIAVNYGSLAGANFMTSASGIIFKGLIENTAFSENSYYFTTLIFLATFLLPIIVISILIFFNLNRHTKHLEIDIPNNFNKSQKETLFLILVMVVIVLIIPILVKIFPTNTTFKFINSKMDIGLIAILFSIIAFIRKLGNEKEIIAKVPWNTLIMICGVGMLISVAIKAGTIDLLSSWIGTNIPKLLIPIVICIVAGIMSFFSSTLGVVAPSLFPIVPVIAATSQLNPALLFVSIILGAQATSISPFSSGGSLILSSSNDEEREELFNQLMFKGVFICLTGAVILSVIMGILL
ncbi:SLC13 family permease (plasmid) [Fusobacterium vincentii]|uniref:SLC13 family permease n=1 Tax=Fusobacterium TaxID=848 RepID=UPI001EEDB59B|nr:SLC13 family permease [Fusobacterium nucleatum]